MLGAVFESAFESTLKSRVHFQQAFAHPVAVALVARVQHLSAASRDVGGN